MPRICPSCQRLQADDALYCRWDGSPLTLQSRESRVESPEPDTLSVHGTGIQCQRSREARIERRESETPYLDDLAQHLEPSAINEDDDLDEGQAPLPAVDQAQTPFAQPFPIRPGRGCHNFAELLQACGEEPEAALLAIEQGDLALFLEHNGQIGLAEAARRAADDADVLRGLDGFLALLPGQELLPARLRVRKTTLELAVDDDESDRLVVRLENLGSRLLAGTIASPDPAISFDDEGAAEVEFGFFGLLEIPVHVDATQLPAAREVLERTLTIHSNGGNVEVNLRIQVKRGWRVPVPIAAGVLVTLALFGWWLHARGGDDVRPAAAVAQATESQTEPADNRAPLVDVISAPNTIRAGDKLVLKLRPRDPDGHRVVLQCRIPPEEWWLVHGQTLELSTAQPGPFRIELRAVDQWGLASATVSHLCQVLPASSSSRSPNTPNRSPLPPTLSTRLSDVNPLVAGGDLTLYVERSPANKGVRVYYQTNLKTGWRELTGRILFIPDLPAGMLVVRLQAIDASGQSSPILTRSWFVPARVNVANGVPTPNGFRPHPVFPEFVVPGPISADVPILPPLNPFISQLEQLMR